MAAAPTQLLKSPFNEPVPDSTAHFWLAVVVLVAYVAVIWWFSAHASALAPTETQHVIQSLGDLVKLAWIWYFLKK